MPMNTAKPVISSSDPRKFTSRKVQDTFDQPLALLSDRFTDWIAAYLRFTIDGVRSTGVTQKITLHLQRCQTFCIQSYGHERVSTCVRRDVIAWQRALGPRTGPGDYQQPYSVALWLHHLGPCPVT